MKYIKTKFIKTLSLILSLTFLICSLFGCGKDSGEMEIIGEDTKYEITQKGTPLPVYAHTFDAIGGENVMPIEVYYGPTTITKESLNGVEIPDFLTDEYYSLLAEAGINVFSWSTGLKWNYDKFSVKKALDLCEKHGLAMYVDDDYLKTPRTYEEMSARLAEYKDHPAFVGLYLEDEPPATRFADFKAINEVYAQIIDANKYPTVVNLFPNVANGYQLSGKEDETLSYKDYLLEFAKSNPGFISYDYYPFTSKDQGTTDGISKGCFQNLSDVREVANANEIPYRIYIQAGGQWEGHMYKKSDPYHPNEGETLWNINSSIAYGVKSICYFTAIQPYQFSKADQSEDYNRNGLLGIAGNINQWYYYIQKANKQIQAAAPVLLHSANVGLVATGKTEGMIPVRDKLSLPWRELQSVNGVNADTGSEVADGVMVGCFDYKGGTALYVVNCSSTEKQKITLKFDKKYGMDVVQRATSVGVAAKELTLTVERGEGVLVALR